jgi:hypothetical protein
LFVFSGLTPFSFRIFHGLFVFNDLARFSFRLPRRGRQTVQGDAISCGTIASRSLFLNAEQPDRGSPVKNSSRLISVSEKQYRLLPSLARNCR